MHPKKQAIKELKAAGFVQIRSSGHDIWQDPITKELIPISHGSGFDEDDLRMIQREIKSIKKKQGRQ